MKIGGMKKQDFIFAAAVLAAALLSGGIFWARSGGNGAADGVLEITIDGELYGSYPLEEGREIEIASAYGKNIIVIEKGSARVSGADCPDLICVGMGEISRDGETICCLPHRLILAVKTEVTESPLTLTPRTLPSSP